MMAVPSIAHRADGSVLTGKQQHDPVQWMRFYAEQQNDDDDDHNDERVDHHD